MSDKPEKDKLSTKVTAKDKPEDYSEYHVPIIYHRYGYVKVRAKNEDQANLAVRKMNRRKLRSFFKLRCEMIDIKEENGH